MRINILYQLPDGCYLYILGSTCKFKCFLFNEDKVMIRSDVSDSDSDDYEEIINDIADILGIGYSLFSMSCVLENTSWTILNERGFRR